MHFVGGVVLPPFNPRKESLSMATITAHGVEWLIDEIFRNLHVLTAGGINNFFQARDKVFCSRHHKHIGVVIVRQALRPNSHNNRTLWWARSL
jgi:hypothetical protein